ncbi:MAGa7180 family putative nuclease [Mycoplasma nasistruthionis]|uniref:YqaJ viral recombinase domain-containing protein n=1 Tax=Mycoplasma nasistruthionis TaxID=353852 RepID=A0A4Y6I6H5_9MOLU|nr:hypothetical protein [Mycoplasma nasistruthionis]QDF64971.1 hypothetical protein FIV53_01465 [Mycoplasma nasistruthionis]
MSNKKITRKYYNNRDYFLDFENRTLTLSDALYAKLKGTNQFEKFKKIGGSSVGNILISDNFKNDFIAYCFITRLNPAVFQTKYIDAGNAIEPKVFDLLRATYPDQVIENYRAEDYGYDYFKDTHPIISGVPDGYIPAINRIVEVKTAGAKKKEAWDKYGVDKSYIKQAQLYSFLKGANSFIIVAAFLNDDAGDYLNPEQVDLTQREVKGYAFTIDQNVVRDDIKKVEEWYKFYTNTNVSPKFDLAVNADLIEYLKCENQQQWIDYANKLKQQGKMDLDFIIE